MLEVALDVVLDAIFEVMTGVMVDGMADGTAEVVIVFNVALGKTADLEVVLERHW